MKPGNVCESVSRFRGRKRCSTSVNDRVNAVHVYDLFLCGGNNMLARYASCASSAIHTHRFLKGP